MAKNHFKIEHEKHFKGKEISGIILGGQDGLVNVLGVVLGVASATNNPFVVMVAGLAATFAETISMAAVAYTSTKADRDYYMAERKLEEQEIEQVPEREVEEIRGIYAKKGFKGKLLDQVVKVITSDKKIWIDTMMTEELNLSQRFDESPFKTAAIVFVATLIGSILPLIPFALLPVGNAIIVALLTSVAVLFVVGTMKAKLTVGNWFISGLELAAIGTTAALTGYFVGLGLGKIFGTNVAGVG
ncbi:MAG: VIT1/CCC1 transporter family protein [Candidatus Aenigmarchaeota archaeon]|nr:VIT1/CCC1 transporter family protein [Candidatus Aenigmarchaeota archaeon]